MTDNWAKMVNFAESFKRICEIMVRKAGYKIISGPRITGDGYYESCILGPEGIQIEITI
jgi:hypothetical protein